MGQKVSPKSFRLGPTQINTWDSIYYVKGDMGDLILQEYKIRSYIANEKKYAPAYISNVVIERPSNKSIVINVYAKKPGVIIGRSGADIDQLKLKIGKIAGIGEVYINVHEVKKPDLNAKIIAKTIAEQLEKRVAFRRAMKKSIESAFKSGAKGVKVSCSGRLAGAEIARTEWYREGRVPLHTLRADIDYDTAEADTTYGVIGVKVWVYKGDKD